MLLEERKIDVEKSSNFEQTEFRIDGKYKNKVLWMLINQYRHKVRTPVQEIISNARDAQRENGNPDKPIKIQLPTKLEPTFIVRDYGVGMDENRIKTIFTSFGASTKNADNSQTGGFGIGAKSPLAYTDSFNIKTYVDGQYWFYVIAKTENEGIGINLLSTGQTTEENGTEVQIPVKKYDERTFVEAACRCTMFWDVKPLFNLMDEDILAVQNGTEISDTLTIYNKSDLGGIFNSDLVVLVDGIPYEIDYQTKNKVQKLKDIDNMMNSNTIAVFELNTGDIDLLQTRESIEETQKTLDKLSNIAFKGFSDLNLYIQSFITEKSLEGAFKQYNDVSGKFRNIKRHKFGVIDFYNQHLELNVKLITIQYSYISKVRTWSSQKLTTPQRHTNKYTFKNAGIFYYDDTKDESETINNRRMKYHLEQTGNAPVLIRQGNATNLEYMQTLRLLKVKKLSSLELPPKKVVVRVKGKVVKKLPENVSFYPIYSGGYGTYKDNSITYKLADIDKVHVYVEYSKSSNILNNSDYVKMLRNEYDVITCRMSMKDIKNVKDNKFFIHIDQYMKTFKPTKKVVQSVLYDILKAFDYNRIDLEFVSKNSAKIKNKTLTSLAQCAIIKEEVGTRVPRELKKKIQEKYKDKIKKKSEAIREFNKMIKNYPLMDLNVDETENIFYINSKEKK